METSNTAQVLLVNTKCPLQHMDPFQSHTFHSALRSLQSPLYQNSTSAFSQHYLKLFLIVPPREGTIHTCVRIHISISIYTLTENHTSTSIYLQFHLSTISHRSLLPFPICASLTIRSLTLIILNTCNNLINTWCHESPISLLSSSLPLSPPHPAEL